MGDDSIYYNDHWTEEDQEEFWGAIKRARSKKTHYIRMKTHALVRTDEAQKIEAAIDLAQSVVYPYRDDRDATLAKQTYPDVHKSEVVRIAKFISETLENSGDLEQAMNWATLYVEIWTDDVRRCSIPPEQIYDAVELSFLASPEDSESLLRRLEAANENPIFPELRRCARLWRALGREDVAEERYLAAYEYIGGWVGYDDLRTRPVLNVNAETHTSPDHAAEGIVVNHHSITDAVFHANRDALHMLDSVLGPSGPRSHRADGYQLYYQQQTLIPELGAYVGRVLVQQNSARWKHKKPLMTSIIVLDDRELDPFKPAFNRVFFESSLVEWYDEVTLS